MEDNKMLDRPESQGRHNVYLSEIWHTFITNILWEILIFVIIFVAGYVYAAQAPTYYVARANVIVKVDYASVTDGKGDTTLAERYLETVNFIFTDSNLKKYLNSNQTENGQPQFSGSYSCSIVEGTTVVKIAYTHSDGAKARSELKALIVAMNSYLADLAPFPEQVQLKCTTSRDGAEIDPAYFDVSSQSDKSSRQTMALAIAFAGVVGFLVLAMLIGDKISSVDRLEKISNRKNLISVGRVKTSADRKPSGDYAFIPLKLGKLSDTLIFMQDGNNNKVYQIQSTHAGEGKTTITCNLAKSLGKSQRKVVIIDCDFAHPTVHRFMQQEREIGITDYTKGIKTFDEIVKRTALPNVDLITCGETVGNHTVMYTSARFTQLINEAREKYDFVLVDCAPVKAMSDYISISPLVDATILVVESDKVKSKELMYCVSELEECGANVIGTVFNRSRSVFAKEYYYYYGKKKKYYYHNAEENVGQKELPATEQQDDKNEKSNAKQMVEQLKDKEQNK